jgi:hypothetical protein
VSADVVHVQDWVDHVLVTPTYDPIGFRRFVNTNLWMARPQYLRELRTWSFDGLHRKIVRSAVRRFFLCEECLHGETRCVEWIDYVLEEYARTTGQTFGRKTREERSVAEAVAALGVDGILTAESVQRAFRVAVLKAHPDLGGSVSAVQLVIEARDRLLEELGRMP